MYDAVLPPAAGDATTVLGDDPVTAADCSATAAAGGEAEAEAAAGCACCEAGSAAVEGLAEGPELAVLVLG